MSELRLAFDLGWSTLLSRPTLTLLAVGLLALGAAVMGGLSGTIYLLRDIQTEFLSALTVEIELAGDSDSLRNSVTARAHAWPTAESVQYVSPATTLHEIERETGEDLSQLLGSNPFPPLIRVRFRQIEIATLDSLTATALTWPGVTGVVYPKQLWNHLNRLLDMIQGRTGAAATALALIALSLVGLCLRAQVRNRTDTWELVGLLGLSEKTLGLALLVQEIIVGAIGGLVACLLLYVFTSLLSWLLIHNVGYPLWFFVVVWLGSVALAVLAGVMSPRRFDR